MDSVGRLWIAGTESLVEDIDPVLCCFLLKSLAEGRICAWSLKQAVNNRSEVETGTASKQDMFASSLDVSDRCIREGLIVGDGEGLGNIYAVYEVMPCCLLFFGGRLGGADVHLPIDLSGIDGDNFGIETLR
jgi:hypothetical protein